MINVGKFLASCFEVYSLTHVHVVNKLSKIDVSDASQTDVLSALLPLKKSEPGYEIYLLTF